MDLGGGTAHFPGGIGRNDLNQLPGTFSYSIWNPNITATAKPHRADSYILLSAGPDGRYGTAADVANFPVNKY